MLACVRSQFPAADLESASGASAAALVSAGKEQKKHGMDAEVPPAEQEDEGVDEEQDEEDGDDLPDDKVQLLRPGRKKGASLAGSLAAAPAAPDSIRLPFS